MTKIFLVLFLVCLTLCDNPQDDFQMQQQQLSMKRTACLVLSRYHSNTQKQKIEQSMQQLQPENQQKYINKMYATAIEHCMPKITMDQAQKFFVQDANFSPQEMFYIYDGFDYANVDISSFSKNQQALVKFIKNFDEEMAVRREEKQAEKDVREDEGFSMKFFGVSATQIPSSFKFVYFIIFAAVVSGAIWYLMSKIDDGKVKKSDLKKKKSKSPSKVEPASPKAKKN